MDDINNEAKSSIEIIGYNNSIELGRVLGHKGALEILFLLKNGPKRFTDLRNELHLKKSTFENSLKELFLSVRLIKKIEAVIKNRDGHQYTLTSFGKEILSFIERYERFMLKPITQKTLYEADKQMTKNNSPDSSNQSL